MVWILCVKREAPISGAAMGSSMSLHLSRCSKLRGLEMWRLWPGIAGGFDTIMPCGFQSAMGGGIRP